MSRFHPMQHGGDSDFQMWQQQMMYKQLQEFQRQQQQQQLDHGTRTHTSFGQLHAPAKPAPATQLPTMPSEMPTNEVSSYTWSNNFACGDPRMASNSQMLNAGSMNWEQFGGASGNANFVNGSVYSHSQNQSMRPLGLAPNQADQSFYPMSASTSRSSGNQYSQFLGYSVDSPNANARAGAEQSDKPSRFSSTFNSNPMQNSRGKEGLLSHTPLQSQGDNTKVGSALVNHLQHGFKVQDFRGRPNQVEFQVNLQQKPTLQVGPTSSGASLDPTEEKILFGNDENGNWGALLRAGNPSGGTYDHGNSLDNDDFSSAFPSLQSGSWSALMQEALQSTSSDNGLQEEWSGLNFQKTDQLIANNLTLSGQDQKRLANLNERKLQSASPRSTQYSPACNNAGETMNHSNFTSFQHAMVTPYEQQDKISDESPSASVTNQQSTTEANSRYFRQSLTPKQSDQYVGQEQMHLSNGIWAQQKPELLQSNAHNAGSHVVSPNAHGLWMSQQNTFNHNFNRESSNNQNDWHNSNQLEQDTNDTSNVVNGDGKFWKSSGGNTHSFHRLEQLKPNMNTSQISNGSFGGKNISMVNLSMPTINQEQYQMVIGQSGEDVGRNHNLGRRVPGISELPVNNPDECNPEYLNAASNEGQGQTLNHGQHVSSSDLATTRNSYAGKDAQNFGQSSQHTMGSFVLQNHFIGGSGMNIGHSPADQVSNTRSLPQSLQSPNNLEHRLGTRSLVASSAASVNEKMPMEEEQLNSQRAIPNNSSDGSLFGGPKSGFPQNREVQTSQHMLQFLHKVDNSTGSNAVAAGDMPNRCLDVGSAHQQLNQPSLQGFGLRLAPPSQRQPVSGHLWPTNTSVDGKQPDHTGQEEDLKELASTPSHPSARRSFHSPKIDSTGQPCGHFPQIRSSGEQYPVVESRSGSISYTPQHTQHGSTATMFKNVWTNISAQRLASLQPNKITPNILQSMMFPNDSVDSNLWSSPKAHDQGLKAETPSHISSSPANSQSQEAKQVVDNYAKLTSTEMVKVDPTGYIVSEGKEPSEKHSLDGNFAGPISSSVQLHQPGIMNAKQGENPAANFQAMNASLTNASSGGGTVLHGSPTLPNIQQQNYSLLHQMQATRRVDVDLSNTFERRPEATEMVSDALQSDRMAVQRLAYGANNLVRSSTDNIGGARLPSSIPSDVKMLSFGPQNNDEMSPSIPSQLPSREASSHDMVTARNHLQNQVPSLGTNTQTNLIERSERPRANHQLASPWLEQYGSYRNGQTLAMYNAQKTPTPPCNFPKVSWSMDSNYAVEHRVDSGQSVGHRCYMSSIKMEHPQITSNIKASPMVKRPKKRKFTAPLLVSWHKIIEGPRKLRNVSISEMDWAHAVNRLIEKVEDDAELLEDSSITYLPHKRLILTSRLIQRLLPAIPLTILRAEAVSAYESATYTVARLTLGDACSMAPSSSGNSCTVVDNENNSPEQTKSVEKIGDKFLKSVEIFIGRFKKMENDFVSLNRRTSMLDAQLECQDLERISIINRLGRFHGRNHAGGIEASEIASRRIFPERHVVSFAVPGNLPEGVFCLSL